MKVFPLLLILPLCLISCEEKYPTDDNLRDGVTRVTDFLYESHYCDYSPAPALRLSQQADLFAGACSAVRNGRYVGRNFDWYFDTSVECIIHVPHSEDHYASVGIAGGLPTVTAQVVEKGVDSSIYEALPYGTLDGINEHGVFCCINMVPALDGSPTDNTLPGADSLAFSMVPRYVLDHAATAAEAVDLLRHVNIVSTKALDIENHFMIADSTATYIVEWINGQLSVADSFNILTNFYLLQPMTPHSVGIERYNIAVEHYAETASIAGMTEVMQMLRQSRMYDRSVSPFWYSEYNGDWTQYGLGDLTIESLPEDYEKCIENDINNYNMHQRDFSLDIWHTKHTGIYDLSSRSVIYYVQEDYSKYFEYHVEL